MSFITMRDRGEVTIPGDIRKALALEPGTVLEAHAEGGRIVLEAREFVSRTAETLDEMLAESLSQADRGETIGPFTGDEWSEYVDSVESRE